MHIIVTGKHVDITDPIREYAQIKAAKMQRYYDRVQSIEVVADKTDGHTFGVEMIAHVEGRDHVVATSRSQDLYAAIDEVQNKMERQLTDHKEKHRNRKHPKL